MTRSSRYPASDRSPACRVVAACQDSAGFPLQLLEPDYDACPDVGDPPHTCNLPVRIQNAFLLHGGEG